MRDEVRKGILTKDGHYKLVRERNETDLAADHEEYDRDSEDEFVNQLIKEDRIVVKEQ